MTRPSVSPSLFISLLSHFSRKPLIMCVEKQLVGDHLQETLDKGTASVCKRGVLSSLILFVASLSGFESLLEAGRHSDLSLLFHLFSRFREGLPLLQRSFSGYIKVGCVRFMQCILCFVSWKILA